MIRRFAAIGLLPLSVFLLCQCADKDPGPVLVGQTDAVIAKGDALFSKAQAKENQGKHKAAIKLYDEVATDYGFSTHAGEARYRQAKLLDREGDIREAFVAYDNFLKYHPNHPKYGEALDRLYEIAMNAKDGKVNYKFMGIKQETPVSDKTKSKPGIVEMLAAVKAQAPMSSMAAKAQYAIGEAYLSDEKYNESVAAFRRVADDHRNHPLAPEALFRVGKILLENAERGNQNQATIDLSREAFNDYLIQFPGHKRNAEARKMISSLGARDLQRTIEIADFYYKTGKMESAKIYYRDVVKRSKSGQLHDHAQARLKEIGN